MNKKNLPHIITVVSFVVFIVLGLACASSSNVRDAASVDELISLRDKFDWLNANAETGGNYVLEVVDPASFNRAVNLTYRNKSDITITLMGMGRIENQTITTNDVGGLFIVGSGVTLILDNITLQGVSSGVFLNSAALVRVQNGGTLIMKDGSIISGHTNDGNGGGVYVGNGGIFLMEGGTIIRNFSCYTVGSAKQQAQSQAFGSALVSGGVSQIPGVGSAMADSVDDTPPEPPTRRGGGVYVAVGGTFTKTGGTIAGFTNTPSSSNAVMDPNGRPISDSGHAVFAATGTLRGLFITNPGSKRKEITAGPDANLHISSDGTFSGNWDF